MMMMNEVEFKMSIMKNTHDVLKNNGYDPKQALEILVEDDKLRQQQGSLRFAENRETKVMERWVSAQQNLYRRLGIDQYSIR